MQASNDLSEQMNYDSILLLKHDSEDVVSNIIESIITEGANILHRHYLKTQVNTYSAKNIGFELIMNSTWAKLPLGSQPSLLETLPDDDLELPQIDSWANGALSVFESMPIRSSYTEEYPIKRITKKENIENNQIIPQNSLKHPAEKINNQPTSPRKSLKSRKIYSNKTIKTLKLNNEALPMNKLLEETKKSSGKNITTDSDFNVIEIVEPKNFAASLIIPKVTTKRFQKAEPPKPSKPKHRIPIQRRETKIQKKKLPKLLQIDEPLFDEGQQSLSISEKIVCTPGVTFKEGNFIKSKPLQQKPNELSRAQYQEYLEELKKSSESNFLE